MSSSKADLLYLVQMNAKALVVYVFILYTIATERPSEADLSFFMFAFLGFAGYVFINYAFRNIN